MLGDALYRVGDRWVLVPDFADLTGELAEFADEPTALAWLLRNGYAPLVELVDHAQRTRLH